MLWRSAQFCDSEAHSVSFKSAARAQVPRETKERRAHLELAVLLPRLDEVVGHGAEHFAEDLRVAHGGGEPHVLVEAVDERVGKAVRVDLGRRRRDRVGAALAQVLAQGRRDGVAVDGLLVALRLRRRALLVQGPLLVVAVLVDLALVVRRVEVGRVVPGLGRVRVDLDGLLGLAVLSVGPVLVDRRQGCGGLLGRVRHGQLARVVDVRVVLGELGALLAVLRVPLAREVLAAVLARHGRAVVAVRLLRLLAALRGRVRRRALLALALRDLLALVRAVVVAVLGRRPVLGHDLLLEGRDDARGEAGRAVLALDDAVGVGLLVLGDGRRRLVLALVDADLERLPHLARRLLEAERRRLDRAACDATGVLGRRAGGAADEAARLAGLGAAVGAVALLVVWVPLLVAVLDVVGLARLELLTALGRLDLVDVDAEVLAHEAHAHRVREAADLVRLARHGRVDHVGVADDARQLRVAVAALRALVDVGRADDGNAVVDDHALGVDVGLKGGGGRAAREGSRRRSERARARGRE